MGGLSGVGCGIGVVDVVWDGIVVIIVIIVVIIIIVIINILIMATWFAPGAVIIITHNKCILTTIPWCDMDRYSRLYFDKVWRWDGVMKQNEINFIIWLHGEGEGVIELLEVGCVHVVVMVITRFFKFDDVTIFRERVD